MRDSLRGKPVPATHLEALKENTVRSTAAPEIRLPGDAVARRSAASGTGTQSREGQQIRRSTSPAKRDGGRR